MAWRNLIEITWRNYNYFGIAAKMAGPIYDETSTRAPFPILFWQLM